MKILIVKTSAIGDVIQSFEVLEYLRRRFPEAQIDWVVEESCRALLEAHPMLSTVLSMKRKTSCVPGFLKKLWKTKYDLIVDLQGNIKSGVVTLLARGSCKLGYGKKSVAEWPNLLATTRHFDPPEGINVRQRYLSLVQDYFADEELFSSEGVSLRLNEAEQERLEGFEPERIMVAFGSKWPNKQLSVETLIEFLKRVEGKYVVPFLGNEEKQVAERILEAFPDAELVGDLSLPLWQQMMERSSCVIAMDSASLHLAGTTKTPTFGVFGPSSSRYYNPIGGAAFQGECPYEVRFKKRCPRLRSCKTGACMKKTQVESLLKSFESLTFPGYVK